jgi:UDP-N-acetylglucosamine acyltransferase
MADVHATAIVHPRAQLADGVTVGPYAIVGEHVTIGPNSRLGSHVVVAGRTTIGANCEFFPFCSIGQPPQDLKYRGEPTRLEIGDHNVIREYVTLNLGTAAGGGVTTIGDHNFFMAYVHVAHDCHIGNHTILANAATLAGHITINDYALVGGLVAIHQYIRIGAYAMIGGFSGITLDVPPYMLVSGRPATLHGVNSIGLRRRGFSAESIKRLKQVYQQLFRSGLTRKEALKKAREQWGDNAEVMRLVQFIEQSERGVCSRGKRDGASSEP